MDLKSASLQGTFFLFLSLLFTGCALGPVSSYESARSLGKGQQEIIGGYGMGGPTLKWNYGATEKLDLGLHLESMSLGLRAKYAFTNYSEEGAWNTAAAFGFGDASFNDHLYFDLMSSYNGGQWEPYTHFRYVVSRVDRTKGSLSNGSVELIHYDSNEEIVQYGQLFLGTRYAMNSHWFWTLEASSIFLPQNSKQNSTAPVFLIGTALSYKF